MSDKSLPETYYDLASIAIDEKGVHPQIAVLRKDDDGLEIMALDMGAEEIVHFLARRLAIGNVKELVFGLDRSTRPGQGTEFADVLTVQHWDGVQWHPSVINYQHEPRIVRPYDTNNTFWNDALRRESQYLDRAGGRMKGRIA